MTLCSVKQRSDWRAGIRLGVCILALMAVFAHFPAQAREKLPKLLQFSIQDENGNFFHQGEIEFCTADGECLFADINPGFPGHFLLPTEDLKPGVPYTVFVYDTDVNVLFEMRGWTFIPEDYDAGYSPYWELDQFLVFPNFKAHADRRLTFHLETTLNPEWKVVSGLGYANEDLNNLPDWPTFLLGLEVPTIFGGNFAADDEASGGVPERHLGLGLSGVWRSKYPRVIPHRDRRVIYRQFGVAYHQTRYVTSGVYFPWPGK
jgi:hypothetical protein